jgi:hypothetical protein
MPKTKLSSRIKIALLRIMEAMGTTASHWASNAKLRVQEINLEARRHEILTEASLQAFELWHNGVKLPDKLSDMFKELSALDDKLSILRAQKYAKVKIEANEAAADGKKNLNADESPTEAPSCEPQAKEMPAAKPPKITEPVPNKATPSPKKAPAAAKNPEKPKTKS